MTAKSFLFLLNKSFCRIKLILILKFSIFISLFLLSPTPKYHNENVISEKPVTKYNKL